MKFKTAAVSFLAIMYFQSSFANDTIPSSLNVFNPYSKGTPLVEVEAPEFSKAFIFADTSLKVNASIDNADKEFYQPFFDLVNNNYQKKFSYNVSQDNGNYINAKTSDKKHSLYIGIQKSTKRDDSYKSDNSKYREISTLQLVMGDFDVMFSLWKKFFDPTINKNQLLKTFNAPQGFIVKDTRGAKSEIFFFDRASWWSFVFKPVKDPASKVIDDFRYKISSANELIENSKLDQDNFVGFSSDLFHSDEDITKDESISSHIGYLSNYSFIVDSNSTVAKPDHAVITYLKAGRYSMLPYIDYTVSSEIEYELLLTDFKNLQFVQDGTDTCKGFKMSKEPAIRYRSKKDPYLSLLVKSTKRQENNQQWTEYTFEVHYG